MSHYFERGNQFICWWTHILNRICVRKSLRIVRDSKGKNGWLSMLLPSSGKEWKLTEYKLPTLGLLSFLSSQDTCLWFYFSFSLAGFLYIDIIIKFMCHCSSKCFLLPLTPVPTLLPLTACITGLAPLFHSPDVVCHCNFFKGYKKILNRNWYLNCPGGLDLFLFSLYKSLI